MGSRYAPEDADLPKPWRALVAADTGFLFFWNPVTGITQYQRPTDSPDCNPNPKLESPVAEEECGSQNERPRTDQLRKALLEEHAVSDEVVAKISTLEATRVEKHREAKEDLHSNIEKMHKASGEGIKVDRELEEIKSYGCADQQETLSLDTKGNTHMTDAEQAKHLQDWEQKIHDDQNKLIHARRLADERELVLNEMEVSLMRKKEELRNAHEIIEGANVKMKNLELKEKYLLEVEENLNASKREIQNFVNDHTASVFTKRRGFELEMEEKRKSFDEEVKSKLDAVNKEKNDICCKEEQLRKREQMLENKLKELESREQILDIKSEGLKEREQTIWLENKSRELGGKGQLLDVNSEALKEQAQTICLKEILILTRELREEYLKLLGLQQKLKEEIQHWMIDSLPLLKENVLLKKKVENFDKEQEILDEKRMVSESAEKKPEDEKETSEKLLRCKQEGLKIAGAGTQGLEEIELRKEVSEIIMDQGESVDHAGGAQYSDEEMLNASRYADPLRAYSSKKRHRPEGVSGQKTVCTESLSSGESFLRQLRSASRLRTPKSYNLRSCMICSTLHGTQ